MPGSVNMEVSPNICYRNAFARQLETHWYTEIHCESIGSFKDESCTIGYISHLNWNWIAQNRAGFFNGFELYVKFELFRSS